MSNQVVCPLSGELITLLPRTDGVSKYEYSSKILGHIEWSDVAFHSASGFLSNEEKHILAGVCRNNKEKEIQPTKIIQADLQKLLNLDIPYDFNGRTRLLLHFLNDKTGKDFRTIDLNTVKDATITYSSPEEFKRIVKFLKSKDWIEWNREITTKQVHIFQEVHITEMGKSLLLNPVETIRLSLNEEIDEIELGLRSLISKILSNAYPGVNWETLITGDPKNEMKGKIKLWLKNHPGFSITDFNTLPKVLQFSDVSHLQKIITNAHWPYFEQIFKDRLKTVRHLEDFATLRHTIKHNRELSSYENLAGRAAIVWLKMTINAL